MKPNFKSGNPESLENDRLSSNLHQFSLILKKYIFRSIYPRIRPWICDQQHGFLKHCSTVTQLLLYLDQLYLQLDVNGPSFSVFSHFSKTFDLVSQI